MTRRAFFNSVFFTVIAANQATIIDPYMRKFWWIEKIVRPLQRHTCCFSDSYINTLQISIGRWEIGMLRSGRMSAKQFTTRP